MNRYHCETCEHLHVTVKGMPPDCEKTNHWLTESDRKLMKEVGCASHIGLKREKMLDELVKATKMRIRQLFLDDSKCDLCEKIDEADGYDGQNEGCEKGLCIECAIDKALREFAEEIRQQRGR